MSGLSDQEWEDFLTSEDEDEPASSPFAGNNEDPIDPIIFVESTDAPELRATNLVRPRAEDETTGTIETVPYFVSDVTDNSRQQWVPAGEESSAQSIETAINKTSDFVSVALRILLFLAPLAVIVVSFQIALNIE